MERAVSIRRAVMERMVSDSKGSDGEDDSDTKGSGERTVVAY